VVKRYTGRRWVVSPARREHQALEELQRAGLRVPKAVGFFDGDGASVVAMEHVQSDSDLRAALHEAEPSALGPLIDRLFELVLALHTRGWHHRDLYLHHILIDKNGDLVLIDLGRARRLPWVRRRWFAKDLAALLLWAPDEVGASLRLRFLTKYMDAMGISGRRERRRFASDILRRRERMARHQPRHGETEPWEPST
jgi:serine/threonine protein kinase